MKTRATAKITTARERALIRKPIVLRYIRKVTTINAVSTLNISLGTQIPIPELLPILMMLYNEGRITKTENVAGETRWKKRLIPY